MSVNFMVRREQLEDDTVYYQVISPEMHERVSAAHIEADRLNALIENAESGFNSILESENTALTAEVARLRDEAERGDVGWRAIIRDYDAEVARLREVVDEYAQHGFGCPRVYKDSNTCKCGLDKALAQEVAG